MLLRVVSALRSFACAASMRSDDAALDASGAMSAGSSCRCLTSANSNSSCSMREDVTRQLSAWSSMDVRSFGRPRPGPRSDSRITSRRTRRVIDTSGGGGCPRSQPLPASSCTTPRYTSACIQDPLRASTMPSTSSAFTSWHRASSVSVGCWQKLCSTLRAAVTETLPAPGMVLRSKRLSRCNCSADSLSKPLLCTSSTPSARKISPSSKHMAASARERRYSQSVGGLPAHSAMRFKPGSSASTCSASPTHCTTSKAARACDPPKV